MNNEEIKAGTAGGTLLTVLLQLQAIDFVKTALFAAVGAAVSFGVTLFLKWVIKQMK
ncbi:hypothetical protein [Solitalea longa]|uniref:hypothetical protein n=1 Tax=Solitalea longa TaxID=2079460 RepID=UPI0013FDF322|nr:hypothetical protein [Solitalea longa]